MRKDTKGLQLVRQVETLLEKQGANRKTTLSALTLASAAILDTWPPQVGLKERRRLVEIALQHIELEELPAILNAHGFNVSRVSDYYSPLPVVSTLQRNLSRWFNPAR
jgi:hypothetical protein